MVPSHWLGFRFHKRVASGNDLEYAAYSSVYRHPALSVPSSTRSNGQMRQIRRNGPRKLADFFLFDRVLERSGTSAVGLECQLESFGCE